MIIREGDLVFCFRTLYDSDDRGVIFHFKKGGYYKVSHINKDDICLEKEEDNEDERYHVYIKDNNFAGGYITHRFSDYFMTVSELRKNKILKIGNVYEKY